VFDLQTDPHEKHDLSSALPPEASALIEDLWKRVERVWERGSKGTRSTPIPKDLEEQLRALGYIR
jgi:hypothetical protein